MTNDNPDISVVVLCYRAEDFAATFAAQMRDVLEKSGLNYEMILVANYLASLKSNDSTPEVVKQFCKNDPKSIPVILEKKGMMGWDMRSGLDRATGDTIAIIDGDGQMFPEDVIRVYLALKRNNNDIAKTYRTKRYDGFYRSYIISKTYNTITKLLFPRIKAKDINSKPKIFTKTALKKLNLHDNGWCIDLEIMLKASYLDMSITEVPTTFNPNEHRRSFVGRAAIIEFIKNLIVLRLKLWLGLKLC